MQFSDIHFYITNVYLLLGELWNRKMFIVVRYGRGVSEEFATAAIISYVITIWLCHGEVWAELFGAG